MSGDELDLDEDQSREDARQEALALVRNVALKGETLLASEEYQSLIRKEFFITSIIWRAKQIQFPHSIVEFEAAFDEPDAGKGFKYFIRGALNFSEGEYTKTLRPVATEDKERFLTLIEQTATATILAIRESLSPTVADEAKPGGAQP